LKDLFTRMACSALLFVTTTLANCQQPSPVRSPTVGTAAQQVSPVIPDMLKNGTPIRLRLARTISSASERAGNSVDFEVSEAVSVNEVLIITVGAVAVGTVSAAEPKKRLGRAGKLELTLDRVHLADGEEAPITATETGTADGPVKGATIAKVAAGLAFFPTVPLVLLMHGRDMSIPKGTAITAYVKGDQPLTMSKFTPAASLPAQR
jgi:hypothetical protein